MPEVMRLFAERLRQYVVNRRSARRYKMRLPVKVALIASNYIAKSEDDINKDLHISSFVHGHTQDISESGLAILTNRIHVEGRYLTDQDRMLLVRIRIGDDTVQLKATAKRHQPVELEAGERGFLIGAVINDIDDENRSKLSAYLKS